MDIGVYRGDWGDLRRVASVAVLALLVGSAGAQGVRPTPPPVPEVLPFVSAPADVDLNGTKVDDGIETRALAARGVLARRDASTEETSAAQALLNERVQVELIFNRQITQAQIDAFLKAGGVIDKVFTNVSFGWTGSISRGAAVEMPSLMGEGFLGIIETKPTQLFLDEAGRTGRVRPAVWNLGIDGNNAGAGKTTIAIVDSGVDGTHADLAGRQEYWKDWTADNRATAQDVGHHGSHVAGIATGSGVSSPAGTGVIRYTDAGRMPTNVGSFYPSPIHIPANVTSFDWTSTMVWGAGAGVTARLAHAASDSAGGWFFLSSWASGTVSPMAKSDLGVTNPPAGLTNRYSAYASKSTAGSATPAYAITNTVTYASPGDGYPTFRGMAPGANWAGFKVFQDSGSGTELDIAEAIDDVVSRRSANSIKVANLSLGIIGGPGISTTLRNKVNNAAANGVVVVVAAGNDGEESATATGEVDDPARAHYAITVAATSDVNQLTAYSNHGFAGPGQVTAGDEDMKPDIMAPGGSQNYQSSIMSIDSNTADSHDSVGTMLPDQVANDYTNMQGTSMATPYIAGCAALVIDAMQQAGETWDFSGAGALVDVLRVKMVLLMTATESNLSRENGPSGNPALNRGTKDINEGFGIVNGDAAVEASVRPVINAATVLAADTFGAGVTDRRCWARRVSLTADTGVLMKLDVPPGGDFDLYIYSGTPDAFGNPRVLASSVAAGAGSDEQVNYVPTATETGYMVVKRVSGAGDWVLAGPSAVSAWTLYE